MHREANRLDSRQLGRETIRRQHVVMGNAEFVFFAAGRDVGVRLRVNVGVDPKRDTRGLAARCRNLAQLPQFRHRLDVDLVDFRIERGA